MTLLGYRKVCPLHPNKRKPPLSSQACGLKSALDRTTALQRLNTIAHTQTSREIVMTVLERVAGASGPLSEAACQCFNVSEKSFCSFVFKSIVCFLLRKALFLQVPWPKRVDELGRKVAEKQRLHQRRTGQRIRQRDVRVGGHQVHPLAGHS